MRHRKRFTFICILAALVWGIAIFMTFSAMKQQYQANAAAPAKFCTETESTEDGGTVCSSNDSTRDVLAQTAAPYEESAVIGEELEVVVGVPDETWDDGIWFGN